MRGANSRWCGIPELVAAWWNVDRVRISPEEGIWLRLTVGSFIERDRVMYEVVERETLGTSEDPLVGYRCVAGSQSARLLVTPGSPPWNLIGDLSRWSVNNTNIVHSCRLLWEDRAGVHVVGRGELTFWPIKQKAPLK